MHTLVAGLLWLAVGTAGVEAQPDATAQEAIRAEAAASSLAGRPLLGPIRRSLEAVQTSLSMLETGACADTAESGDTRRLPSRRAPEACLTMGQPTPNTPNSPSTLHSPMFYFLVTLLAAGIAWLLSKL